MCRSVTLTGLKNDAKPAMVCTANDLLVWKDFPKGLRVLLLDEDCDSAVEIRSKLEEMNYIVSTFCNESEARLAVSNKIENFQIAIVEVNISNSNEIFKFLETAKELPTIMTSKIHCINTIMKCIALGAVEFLQKPLSEDKLRNIWQHVVHKAFNAKKSGISESLKPLQIQLENGESGNRICIKVENESRGPESNPDHLAGSDKFPAPSTPQIEQGGRLLIDGDCQDQTNCSSEKECGDRDGECKSVETTCGNSVAVQDHSCQRSGEIDIKEESDSADGPKSENNVSVHPQNKDDVINFGGDSENSTKMSRLQNSGGSKANRKKAKVDWTPELHKKFVQAVEQLGIDQAVPSRILELMKVEGLTRHNVASHLQKYRMHQRHILPKVEDPVRRVYYPHKPIMPYPPYHSPHTFPTAQVYPYRGQPSSQQSGFQAWGPVGYSAWQPAETWHWNPYSAVHADAWGCPVMTTPHTTCSVLPQNSSGIYNGCGVDSSYLMPNFCTDLHPAEDEIDKVVQEAMNKPWLPLPLGLRPPSTDTILAELSKQGISTIPSRFINGSNLH